MEVSSIDLEKNDVDQHVLPTLYQQQIHKTKYARWDYDLERREHWNETVDRYVNQLTRKISELGIDPSLWEDVSESITGKILGLEIMPSMRAMTTAGPALERDNVAGYNCSYLAINRIEAFDEALYILCCGTGVGFSVERGYTNRLPEIPYLQNSNLTIVVEDSKIGWATALRQLISELYKGGIPTWDVSLVRPAGSRLKTFGGSASGPEPLTDLFQYVVSIFKDAQGRKLTSLECHGIMCKIGDIVVVGGVRRAALISLSDPDDLDMRDAKQGEWWIDHPEYRLANNSAVWDGRPALDIFAREWQSLRDSQSGERGIINRTGMQEQARRNFRRDANYAFGTNPCCLAPDTIIMTIDGPRRIDSLLDIPFKALVTGREYDAPHGSWVSGEGEIYRLTLKAGYELELTPEHRIKTSNRGWVEAQHLTSDDLVLIQNHGMLSWRGDGTWNEGYLLGLFLGDGNFINPRTGARGEVKTWHNDQGSVGIAETARIAGDELPHRSDWNGCGDCRLYRRMSIGRLPQKFGMDWGNKHINEDVELTSSAFHEGFLRGLFDADGHIEGNATKGWSIRLSQSDLTDLKAIQRMLLRLGIKSRIYRAKDKGVSVLPDGRGGSREYPTKASWRLVISSSDIEVYAQRVGFSHLKKMAQLKHIVATTTFYEKRFESAMESFEFVRVGEVWDAEVSDVHAFDANGIFAHNSEIILRDRQMCNLSEVVARHDDTNQTLEQKVRLATIVGTIQSTFTDFRYLSDKWRENCEEERLLGVSITGIMDCPLLSDHNDPDLAERLGYLQECAIEENEKWARLLGINQSTAITCCKPSGTVSQLVDAASGIHPRYSEYYIRTNRGNKIDPISQFLYMQGIPTEDDVMKPDETMVFSYPIKSPDRAILRNDITAIDQLKLWLAYAEHWCEHKPSITVYVRDNEWDEVGVFVYNHFDKMSGVSFLPFDNGSYQQAPYQEIDRDTYLELVNEMPSKIDWNLLTLYESEDYTTGSQELACSANGGCEIL
jgi:ribonucleotide reductase class II